MPIANTIHIARAIENEPYVFEGLCSNKKNEKVFSELKKRKLEKQLIMFRLYYERGHIYVELICTEEAREIANGYKMIPVPKVSDYKKGESLERKLSNGYLSFLMPKYPKDFEPLSYCGMREGYMEIYL